MGTPATRARPLAPPLRTAQATAIPASAATVADRLAKSPRHGEYAMIRTGPSDSVRAWVVYPERRSKAPVVVVVHEIFGLSSWVRGVADQLAADGFIAIAPDLLTGKVAPVPGTDTVASQAATAAVRSLQSRMCSARSPRSGSTACRSRRPRSAMAWLASVGGVRVLQLRGREPGGPGCSGGLLRRFAAPPHRSQPSRCRCLGCTAGRMHESAPRSPQPTRR